MTENYENGASGSSPEAQNVTDLNEHRRRRAESALEGLVFGHDDMTSNQPFVVEGIFRPGATVMLHGASRSGKTLTAAYLCACLQTARPFLGRAVNARCGVLWIAAEKPDEAANRLRAAELRQGGDSNLRALFRLSGRNLSDQQTRQKVVEAVKCTDEHFRSHFGVPLGLVVIDTLNRGFAVTSELDGAEAARVFAICDEIKAAIPDAPALMLTHHEPANGSQPRGSTAYVANPDVCIRAHHGGEGPESRFRHIKLTKPQDGADEGPIGRLTFNRDTLPSGDCSDVVTPARGRQPASDETATARKPKAAGKSKAAKPKKSAKPERSDEDIQAAVLRAITAGAKVRDLARIVGANQARCMAAKAALLDAGKLTQDPETRRVIAV